MSRATGKKPERSQRRTPGAEGRRVDRLTPTDAAGDDRLFLELALAMPIPCAVFKGTESDVSRYRLLAANPAFEQVAGRGSTDLIGQDFSECFGTVLPENLIAQSGQALSSAKKAVIPEVRLATRRYGERVFCVTVFPVEKGALGMTFENVTARAREAEALRNCTGDMRLEKEDLQRSLRSSEAHFRSIVENTSDIIGIVNDEGRLEFISPAVEVLSGFSVEELTGARFTDFVHPQDLEDAFSKLSALDGTPPGTVKMSVLRFRSKDGSWRVGESAGKVVQDASGRFKAVCIVRDVTDTRLLEDEVRTSEEKYRGLYESLVEGVVSVDMDGRILDANQAWLDMVGYTIEEARAMTYQQLTPPEWRAAEDDIIRSQVKARGYSDQYEKEYVRKDGSVVPISLRVWLNVGEGEPSGMWAIVRDITEQKKAARDLEAAYADLEGFAHTVSHDLKTPLSSVEIAVSTLPLLLDGPPSLDQREQLAELVDLISRNVLKSRNLIDGLLALACAGRDRGVVRSIDVADVVSGLLEDMSPLLESRGVEVFMDDDLGHLTADETHLYQVFSNLIGNAVMHNAGDAPQVWVSYLGTSPVGSRYMVKDNGPGIPDSVLDDIFVPFHRSGGSSGTGIGLSIVKKIVNAYGGTITASNDDGACFDFVLGSPVRL